ncbi:MAG: ABC transporter substrate-binding protein [Chloroflexota bacterium]
MKILKANVFAAIVLCTALILGACGPAPVPTAAGPEVGPTSEPVATEPVILRVGWEGTPDTLNPAYAFLVESFTVFDLVYSALTTQEPTGEYVGNLAETWSHSEDGLIWKFTLKDGITWHNGTPLTAADVAWALNAVMADPDGWATVSNYVAGFNEVSAPDDSTLTIVTEYPVSNMEYRLSWLYAVYPPDFEGFTTAEDLQNFSNFEIMGTGPFKMGAFDEDARILMLEANDDYYGGRPTIDQIIFQTYDNSDALIQGLKVAEIDMVLDVPQSGFAALSEMDGVKPVSLAGSYFDELIINAVPADHDPAPNKNPALDDPAVRLAMAQAINKQDLVDVVMQGLAEPGDTIVPPQLGGGFWHNTDIQDVPFDLAKGSEVLESAGWVMGADGVRTKGDMRLEFRLQFPSDSSIYPRVADSLTGWFGELGIKTTPEAVDPDSLYAATTPIGDYDLVLWGWGPDPDPDFILSVMTSDQFVDGGWSDSGYMNPEYDQLYLDQQETVDRDARRDIIWEMQKMVFDDRPYIVFYYQDLLRAYRSDRFTGFIESPIGIESFQSLLQVKPVQ